MSWIRHFGGRLPDFDAVVRRFPIPLLIMAAFTVWIIANNHSDIWSYRDAEYIASGFVLAGYVAVIINLIVERRNASRLICVIVGLGATLSAFILCYFARKLDFTAVMAIVGAIIFLGNAAAWRSGRQDRNVWNFTQKLWTGALFAAVGSIIFALGMVAISEAVKALFGVDIDKFTYETILPIGLAFLAPLYWLGTLPKYGEAEDVTELSFEARALSFLGTWMLAPLVIIYALIVLAYGAKVLMQWDLPKGEIAQLVSPFIGVGMLVWLMLEPKILKESGFVRFYRAAWHWIMLPAALLLGAAVFVRVQALGFTVIRVFLALVVIWAIVQSVWFLFMPKARRDIRVPTALAAGLLIFGAFAAGPMSLMSQYNQAAEAQSKLPSLDADVVRNNPALAKQFLGGIRYLIRQEDQARFNRLLPDRDMPKNTHGPEYNALLKSLGLNDIKVGRYTQRAGFSLGSEQPIQISGDSKIYSASSVSLFNSRTYESGTSIVTSQRGKNLALLIEGEVYRVNLEAVFRELDLIGQDDETIDIIVPDVPIVSNSGTSARLTILDGRLFYEGDTLRSGNISFIVIVPN